MSSETRTSETRPSSEHTSRRNRCFPVVVVFITLISTAYLPFAQSFSTSRPNQRPSFGVSSLSSRYTSSRTVPCMSSVTELPASAKPSFEKRMRNLVLGGNKKKAASRRSGSKAPPNLKVVRTLKEYKAVVGDEGTRIVAVRFFAPWCKACKAVAPLYYRLANQFPDVVFVEVPVTEKNANLHQGLGVQALPFGHIYHPEGGLVEEQSISRKNFARFDHKLRSYISGSCELESEEYAASPYQQPLATDDHSTSTITGAARPQN
jgi:thiol-disulfide isomerase/thioredoxin|mmetsp:Transcript_8659/g.13268  ORF Transcript_8659/g.13268 Transcript_8659/m.13268 type:complete len:263 (+) Transcript_8659:225-1013(+)